jgi:hypothetical protein
VSGPPHANNCECFFELGGADLLPAPMRQEHEPPRPVQSESLETPEPAPPREVAGLRVGYAVRFDPKLDLRAFDKRGQNLAGHASIQLTLDRYSHWMPSMGKHTASAMDEVLDEDDRADASEEGKAAL